MTDSPIIRLIALGIVGGVAKALFAPGWQPATPIVRAVAETGQEIAKHATKS